MAEEVVGPPRSVTPEELKVVFSGPALLTNRMFVTLDRYGVRIAFTEQKRDDVPSFRTAVVMSLQDAIALRNLLDSRLKPIEAQIQSAEEGLVGVPIESDNDGTN